MIKHPYSEISRDSKAADYLCNHCLLKLETLQKYGVGYANICFCGGRYPYMPSIAFQLRENGKVAGIKYMSIDRVQLVNDSNERLIDIVDLYPYRSRTHLYGIHTVDDCAKTIVICDSEINAMTVHDCGLDAVSLPYGRDPIDDKGRQWPANSWIDRDARFLARFDNIRILMGSDEKGQAAARTIAKWLGNARCSVVILPEGCKSPNQMLRDGRSTELIEAIKAARPQK